jgi:hypothetical protein
MAGFTSEQWPASRRKPGRLQTGIVAGFASESRAGFSRNSQADEAAADIRKVQHLLCNLLLDVVCKDTNRLSYIRRHVRVARAALPYMNKPQAEIAVARISKLCARWGEVVSEGYCEPEIHEISPETMVVDFLAQRRFPEAHLKILHRAAQEVWDGETSIHRVMAAALPVHPRAYLHLPQYDSFREWLILMRIAKPDGPGVYRPGILCQWWVQNMMPSKVKGARYRQCLEGSVKANAPPVKEWWLAGRDATPPQTCQSISLFQFVAGGDPPCRADVCPVSAKLAECRRFAVRARHRHLS